MSQNCVPNQFAVYTMPNCPDCQNAKNLLKSKDIPFQELIAGRNFSREEFTELFGEETRTLPQIVDIANRVHVGGYKDLIEYVAQR